MIGHVLTGRRPVPNVPLLPPSGPWRPVVRAATRLDSSRRPQTTHALLAHVHAALEPNADDPLGVASGLADRADKGDLAAAVELFALAETNPRDSELYIGVLPRLPSDMVRQVAAHDPEAATGVARALEALDYNTMDVQFAAANRVVLFALNLARAGQSLHNDDLMEEGFAAALEWDGHWDQWNARDAMSGWLASLNTEEAATIAGLFARYPDATTHFEHLCQDRKAQSSLRSAISSALAR